MAMVWHIAAWPACSAD